MQQQPNCPAPAAARTAARPASPDSILIAALAAALDRLAARISRDLDVDASEGTLPDDPHWAGMISQLADYARECAQILGHPQVAAVLAARAVARPGLADLDAATAATRAVLADPAATPAQRIGAAAREEAAYILFARQPGGAALLEAGI